MTTDTRYRDAALTFALAMLAIYALAAFVGLEANPLRWSYNGRAAYAFGATPVAAWIACAHIFLRPQP